MPVVLTNDIKGLIEEVVEKFELERNTSISSNYKKNFQSIAESIKNKYAIELKGETLYKNVYLKAKRHDSQTIRYNKRYLNGLTRYVKEKDYEEIYPIIPKATPNDFKKRPNVYIILNFGKTERKIFSLIERDLNNAYSIVSIYRDTLRDIGMDSFYDSLEENDRVISLIDPTYLKSEVSLSQLISYLSLKRNREVYWNNTYHLLISEDFFEKKPISSNEPGLNIFSTFIRSDWVHHWQTYEQKVRDKFESIKDKLSTDGIEALEKDLKEIGKISKGIYLLLEKISKDIGTIPIKEENDLQEFESLFHIKSKHIEESRIEKRIISISDNKSAKVTKRKPSLKKQDNIIEINKLKGYYDAYLYYPEINQFYELPSLFCSKGIFRLKGKSGASYLGELLVVSSDRFEIEIRADNRPGIAYKIQLRPTLFDEYDSIVEELSGSFEKQTMDGNPHQGKLYLVRRCCSSFNERIPSSLNPLYHPGLRSKNKFKAHFEQELSKYRDLQNWESHAVPTL